MRKHHTFRSVNEALPTYAQFLLDSGADVPSRVGDTKELTFQHMTLTDPLEREIIVPTRKANIAAQIAETVWVLAGRNDVEWLSHYLPRAAEFSDDGQVWRAGYGPRLREWALPPDGSHVVDQFQKVVSLLQDDPGTRRAVMSIWDPAVDLAPSKDIPCNNWLHFLARDGVLGLHVAIRSNDLVWGWSGINQFEWSVLLEVVAAYAGLRVGQAHYSISSLHMYDRHWERAATYQPASFHETTPTPRFNPMIGMNAYPIELEQLLTHFFALEEALRSGDRRSALFVAIGDYPEPMLRSWLCVLAWWWTGDEGHLHSLAGTRLAEACRLSVQPQRATVPGAEQASGTQAPPSGAELAAPHLRRMAATPGWQKGDATPEPSFTESLIALHAEKHAAYGDSWKKRGEMFSIIPNIARKVDRLGGSETSDETSADTAGDLLVYLAKYRAWLAHPDGDDEELFGSANRWLRSYEQRARGNTVPSSAGQEIAWLKAEFETLVQRVKEGDRKVVLVSYMATVAWVLANRLWQEERQRDAALRQAPAVLDSESHYLGADHD